jgi:hypothetical protein
MLGCYGGDSSRLPFSGAGRDRGIDAPDSVPRPRRAVLSVAVLVALLAICAAPATPPPAAPAAVGASPAPSGYMANMV